jgi:hypothetical protein
MSKVAVGSKLLALVEVEKPKGSLYIQRKETDKVFRIVGVGTEIDLVKHPLVGVGRQVLVSDFTTHDFSKDRLGTEVSFVIAENILLYYLEAEDTAQAVDIPDQDQAIFAEPVGNA